MNCSKSREIVFRSRRIRGRSEHPAPPGIIDIERVDKLTILGVLVNNNLTATDHVSTVLASCASLMYALRVLRSHGLSEQSSISRAVRNKDLDKTPSGCAGLPIIGPKYSPIGDTLQVLSTTRMWANAQPDGRPAEHRWRPLFNAAKFG